MARNTVPRTCETCGVSFRAHVCDVAKGWGRFCSHKCFNVKRARDLPAYLEEMTLKQSDGCWLWQGRTNFGYGRFKHKGKRILAHRLSWKIHNGPIPKGLYVLHKCDVRNCVRPDHLFLGTTADNNADMVAKGRHTHGDRHHLRLHPELRERMRGDNNWARQHPERLKRGEDQPRAKLTNLQADEIRRRYDAGGVSQQKLANEYHVSQHVISHIVRRLAYMPYKSA